MLSCLAQKSHPGISGEIVLREARAGTKLAPPDLMQNIGQEMDAARSEVEDLIALYQSHEGELENQGVNVRETIAELHEHLECLRRLALEAELANQRHARSCARIAQTDTEFFRVMCKLMDPLLEECPGHPMAREWNQARKAWHRKLLHKN